MLYPPLNLSPAYKRLTVTGYRIIVLLAGSRYDTQVLYSFYGSRTEQILSHSADTKSVSSSVPTSPLGQRAPSSPLLPLVLVRCVNKIFLL